LNSGILIYKRDDKFFEWMSSKLNQQSSKIEYMDVEKCKKW